MLFRISKVLTVTDSQTTMINSQCSAWVITIVCYDQNQNNVTYESCNRQESPVLPVHTVHSRVQYKFDRSLQTFPTLAVEPPTPSHWCCRHRLGWTETHTSASVNQHENSQNFKQLHTILFRLISVNYT